jgi:hypothetical protein
MIQSNHQRPQTPSSRSHAATRGALLWGLVGLLSVALAGCGYIFPGLFPVSYEKLDAFVATTDLDDVGPIVAEGHFADSGDSVLHYVAVFENADALSLLAQNLEEAGMTPATSNPTDPAMSWVVDYEGEEVQAEIQILEEGGLVGLGLRESDIYEAAAGAVSVQFMKLAD